MIRAYIVLFSWYLIVWSTTYRYKVLRGDRRLRVRENGVDIVRGVISTDHVHRFVSVPPKRAISDQVGTMKGHSLFKVQREFPQIRKRYWGCRFWGRG